MESAASSMGSLEPFNRQADDAVFSNTHTQVESIVLRISSMLSSTNDESPANVEAAMTLLRGLVDNPYWCMEKNFHFCVELM